MNTATATKVRNVDVMRTYYTKNVLPNIGKQKNSVLRNGALSFLEATGTSRASAASTFNVVQKENIAAGTVDATQVGRGAQALAKASVAAESAGPDLSLPWAVINKESRNVVSTHASRREAASAKTADETVGKTADQ